MQTLQEVLDPLVIGVPSRQGDLQVAPLKWRVPPATLPEFMLAEEALANGTLTVTESGDGAINELFAVSTVDSPILIFEAQEIIGGMQNRLVAADVLLRPFAQTNIPVVCSEHGRWHGESTGFLLGSHAPSLVRAGMTMSRTPSLPMQGGVLCDQQGVWSDIGTVLARTATGSQTSALSAVYEQQGSALQKVLHGVTLPPDAVGVVVTVKGRFAALDIVDSPNTMQRVWPRLATAYAVDVLLSPDTNASTNADVVADYLLQQMSSAGCVVQPGVDLGTDVRFNTRDVVGSALMLEGDLLHLCAFPATSAS